MSSTSFTDEQQAPQTAASPPAQTERRAIALSVDRLSKTYPVPLVRLKKFFRRPFKPPVEALRDVSFEVREGEIFGLIGRNGAGKTTLTKIIATLVQPTSGAVKVKGFDSVRDEERVRAQVGLASAEERSFYWRLTIEQNLLFFARLNGLGERAARTRIRELLSRFELEEMARRRFGELSTGNKQRMAVARALLSGPPVLLLDEPTRSLDPLAAASMRAFIASLARESQPPVTVFLTSHNLAEVEELCERVAVISRGQIRALDTPRGLRALHRQRERLHLTVNLKNGREQISQRLSAELQDFVLEEEGRHFIIAFRREPNDDRLDQAVRIIQELGGSLLGCETEQATLLDVLESYEREPLLKETE
ncbi:MAG TPA: ABC transporter ATP-binding protein [Pyrinomonadaceae bacterium]|jgi:ABC-2 type transport system ATP-binding protein